MAVCPLLTVGASPMATVDELEENRNVVRRISAAVTAGDLDAIDELVTEDYIEHNPAVPSELRGPDAMRAFVEPFLSAFADFELVEDGIIAEGDRVAYRHHATGTHDAAFMGIPPTGERVRVDGIAIYRIEDGKAAEKWIVGDTLGLLRQLGAAPGPTTTR